MEATNLPIEGQILENALLQQQDLQSENFVINPVKNYNPNDLKALKIQKGNPKHLLKAINPSEAALLDTSANAHVRFRLGGERFPPNIYYKIYLHGALCDVNSFAPRDYSSIQKPDKHSGPKITYNQYKVQQKELENEGWYLRIDNNGWRPISHKAFTKTDYVEVFTANKIKYYHYNKEKRLEKNIRKKRRVYQFTQKDLILFLQNKLRWLQKIYMNQMKLSQIKEGVNEKDRNEEDEDQEKDDPQNPFCDNRLLEITDEQLDSEAKKLVEWSEQLDFDKYMQDWYLLSTSNRSDLFVPNQINDQLQATNKIQWSQETSISQQQQQVINKNELKS